jgi:hypothetical protein
MKQASMRDIQINLAKLIDELPIAITRYGQVIAVISKPNIQAIEPKPIVKSPHQLMQEAIHKTTEVVSSRLPPLTEKTHSTINPSSSVPSSPLPPTSELPPTSDLTSTPQTADHIYMWGSMRIRCKFCNKNPAQLMPYKYDDGTGEGEANFCHVCYLKYKNQSSQITSTYEIRQIPTYDNVVFNPVPKPIKKKKK